MTPLEPGAAGRPGAALEAAIRLDRTARAAMGRRDAGAAQGAVDALLRGFPQFAPGWLTGSVLALDLGRPTDALRTADRGLRIAPSEPSLLVQRVRCLHACGRRAEALTAASAAQPATDRHPRLQQELANTLAGLGQHARALALMQQAHKVRADDPGLAFNMAAVLRFLGRFDEAQTLLDAAVAVDPQDWQAYGVRSQLRTQTTDRNHVAELNRLLDPPPAAWEGEVQLRYALAKEYEDLGQDAASFAHLQAGASLRWRHLSYDVRQDVEMLARIEHVLDRTWFNKASAGIRSTAPIFVFGLPRSGTTLVERILTSHPDVQSLGELNDFPAALTTLGRKLSPGANPAKHRLLELSTRMDLSELGELYLARVASQRDDSPRFVDKLPMNYLYAGLIAAALPHAKLVQVVRHPVANGYGLYKTLFQQGYPFSYDLFEIDSYMRAYRRLMSHWRSMLAGRLIVVDYELIVTEPERHIRRLLDMCDLDWNPACLDPHRNRNPSSTQSAVQVRQPIYTHAVDHWRRFETYLHPIRNDAEAIPGAGYMGESAANG